MSHQGLWTQVSIVRSVGGIRVMVALSAFLGALNSCSIMS